MNRRSTVLHGIFRGTVVLNRLVLYVSDIDATAKFYAEHFAFTISTEFGDRIVELSPIGNGSAILLHPAAKGQRRGQSAVKLVFDVRDVGEFCQRSASKGLVFGPIHQADGYQFANAKDPDGNSISVSSRAFRSRDP
jgi:predicted enzyme related to lactoylglutathione lyase